MTVVLFVAAVVLLLHTYCGYPLSLLLLRVVRGDRARHETATITPLVHLVISARNEEEVIADKLRNALALDYPRDRFLVTVVSDASSDRTDEIVRGFAPQGVRLLSFDRRQGKVACLNQAIPGLDGDIVVMSDANSMYEPASLRLLVRHFASPRVGCVCGRLRYVNPDRLAAGEGEAVYWGYEAWIKALESRLGSLLGANGAIYAYRKVMFRPVDPLMFCDDVIPIRIAMENLLTLYDPEAVCREEACDETVEMKRRRRHASFGMRSMVRMAWEAAGRGRWLIVYQCLCHRVLRWLGGILMAVLAVSGALLPAPWDRLVLGTVAVVAVVSAAALVGTRMGLRMGPLYLPYYYLVITMAGLKGLWAFAARTDRPYWDPRQ